MLDKHLAGREFIVGKDYTIADISGWGWVDRASFVLPGSDDRLPPIPDPRRFHAIRAAGGSPRRGRRAAATPSEVDDENAAGSSNYRLPPL